MKVLYAVQGTGNGHLSRAIEIIPALQKRVDLDVLVSGMHSELKLPYPIKYRLNGLGFKFGKKGGIDYFHTWWHGNVRKFYRELQAIDLSAYDLVINDFEPVTAWACRRQHIPCVGLSNQCVILESSVPKPEGRKYQLARGLLKHYAPVDAAYGFSYQQETHFITTPIIRRCIRVAEKTNEGHYLVYLPAYKDSRIIKILSNWPQVRWKVFSKHSTLAYKVGAVEVFPIDGEHFNHMLVSCQGVICAAGFGTTSEALFLGKSFWLFL